MRFKEIRNAIREYESGELARAESTFSSSSANIQSAEVPESDRAALKQAYMAGYVTPVDSRLSRALTIRVNGVHSSLGNVLAVVHEERDRVLSFDTGSFSMQVHLNHQHGLSVRINRNELSNGVRVMEFECAKSAELFISILDRGPSHPLYDAVAMCLHHERAHFKPSRTVAVRREGHGGTTDYLLSPDNSEVHAQLYAMCKAQDPIRAMGGLLALGYFLNSEEMSLDKFLDHSLLKHWSEVSIFDTRASELYDFRFPLRDDAKAMVLDSAKKHLRDLCGEFEGPGQYLRCA
ncbi:MAG: hypothetical protein KGH58_01350 [Candidatus Micrarchaeota archaeon]|nr:hypothetical protein [Candidatus Micrarchaeota archaeon]